MGRNLPGIAPFIWRRLQGQEVEALSRRGTRRGMLLLLPLALLSSMSLDVGGQETLRLILVGDIYPCPVIVLCHIDPRYDFVPIQTREIPDVEAGRYVRIYFPRTTEDLYDYAMLFFVDPEMGAFNGAQVAAMMDAVERGECGTFWTFGPGFGSIQSCDLQKVIPHQMSMGFDQWARGNSFYRVIFDRGLPPVFTSFLELGLEDVRGYGCGEITTRQGATIWGRMVPFQWPWMASWEYGGSGGHCWVAADDLDHPWWSRETYGFSENLYSVDVLANIITYSSGLELPEDIMLPINFRRELLAYQSAKSLFVSTLEFVEKFGANTGVLYGELLDLESDTVSQAKSLYLDSDYDNALSEIRLGNRRAGELVEMALKARERALFWVFLIEWFAVSGVSLVSGYVLWTLMIRRKAYREVRSTRFSG
jgi:hypothetical protein